MSKVGEIDFVVGLPGRRRSGKRWSRSLGKSITGF